MSNDQIIAKIAEEFAKVNGEHDKMMNFFETVNRQHDDMLTAFKNVEKDHKTMTRDIADIKALLNSILNKK